MNNKMEKANFPLQTYDKPRRLFIRSTQDSRILQGYNTSSLFSVRKSGTPSLENAEYRHSSVALYI